MKTFIGLRWKHLLGTFTFCFNFHSTRVIFVLFSLYVCMPTVHKWQLVGITWRMTYYLTHRRPSKIDSSSQSISIDANLIRLCICVSRLTHEISSIESRGEDQFGSKVSLFCGYKANGYLEINHCIEVRWDTRVSLVCTNLVRHKPAYFPYQHALITFPT